MKILKYKTKGTLKREGLDLKFIPDPDVIEEVMGTRDLEVPEKGLSEFITLQAKGMNERNRGVIEMAEIFSREGEEVVVVLEKLIA